MPLQGGCGCGSVRYTLSCDALPMVICCHCLDCQTRSGSAFDLTAFVEPHLLDVTGELLTTVQLGPSGVEITSKFCALCYGEIFNVHPGSPGNLLLRAGTLDDSQSIVPSAHIFTKRKQSWVMLPENVPCFEELPSAGF